MHINEIERFLSNRNSDKRYASFDYCYNYFYKFYKNNEIEKIGDKEHIEKSCLHLGFYLASWGMMRGSSFLLQQNFSTFRKLIENLAKKENRLYWEIDIDNYSDENINHLLTLVKLIEESFGENKPSETLVTKIMLGIFGNIPALDRYFKDGFKQEKFKIGKNYKENLYQIKEFYIKNKDEINKYRIIYTLDFYTGTNTNIPYKKAKIVDMYGFMLGFKNK